MYPEIVTAAEAKLLQYFGSITPEAYPCGKWSGRPPKSESEFGAQRTIIRVPLIDCRQVQTSLFQMRVV
jgi:hypothetical protein